MAAKARAVLHGRFHATTGDVRQVAPAVLRHRLVTTFNAEGAGVRRDDVIQKLLEHVQSTTGSQPNATNTTKSISGNRGAKRLGRRTLTNLEEDSCQRSWVKPRRRHDSASSIDHQSTYQCPAKKFLVPRWGRNKGVTRVLLRVVRTILLSIVNIRLVTNLSALTGEF